MKTNGQSISNRDSNSSWVRPISTPGRLNWKEWVGCFSILFRIKQPSGNQSRSGARRTVAWEAATGLIRPVSACLLASMLPCLRFLIDSWAIRNRRNSSRISYMIFSNRQSQRWLAITVFTVNPSFRLHLRRSPSTSITLSRHPGAPSNHRPLKPSERPGRCEESR